MVWRPRVLKAGRITQPAQSETPDAIISDIRMPGIDGLELLTSIQQTHPELPVIIMTAHSDLESAVASYSRGAFEYLPKPFDIDEAVAMTRRALAHAKDKNEEATETVDMPSTEIIGEAPAMQEVFRAIGRLSNSNISVLINGESGTGKELVAHALHQHGPRREQPFVPLNVAAIPKELIESELFGHEKGAFTGATQQRTGRFEQADGGTCFSMKSAICRRKPRPGCCECSPMESSIASVGTLRSKSMCGSLRPLTRTWRSSSSSTCFARICSTV